MPIWEMDKNLCRTYLADIYQDSIASSLWEERDIWWFQMKGNTNFYNDESSVQYYQAFQDILNGCMLPGCCIGFLIMGTQNSGIRIYAGITADEEMYDTYRRSYMAGVPGIDISDRLLSEEITANWAYGGVVVGLPDLQEVKDKAVTSRKENRVLSIDRFCQGMQGIEFSLMIIAERQPDSILQKAAQKVDLALTENGKFISSSRMGEGGWQITSKNVEAENYAADLEQLKQILQDGFRCGMWSVSVCYGCNREIDLYRIKSMLLSCYAGYAENRYERLVCIDVDEGIQTSNGNVCIPVKLDEYRNKHLLNSVGENGFEYYKYLYQTLMSSKNLSRYICLPQKETPGFYVDEYVEFDTVMRVPTGEENVRIGNITLAGRSKKKEFNNIYSVDLNDLSRHALIVGITGGGKTNTMKVLLSEIWRKNGVPFLVIESAKREYIELKQIAPQVNGKREFDALDVFTLGNETVYGVKYRLNPFEVIQGISLQTHIDYLLSTFNASFEMYAPMPYILERAVYEVYEDKGWDLFSGRNLRGLKEYPTLSQLYYKIDVVTNRLGYDTEVQSNVKAALKARINSLRIGGKGAMLDTPRSIPIGELLSNPTVFELEDIGDDDTKAFVIGMLLVQLYEYRKSVGESKKVLGVLVVEEAHRLLKKVSEGEGNNSRAKAVEFFCNMLAEIRSFGQGIIIADQIPTKLATDIVKNTNLKIVHRTVMEDDRECVGSAMHMTDEQKDYLSSLRRGCAAVFSEGDNRPKLVNVPLVQMKAKEERQISILKIQQSVTKRFAEYYSKSEKEKVGCLYCETRNCPGKEFLEEMNEFNVAQYRDDILRTNDLSLAMIGTVKLFEQKRNKEKLTKQQKICVLSYFLQKLQMPEEWQAEMMVNYVNRLFPQ